METLSHLYLYLNNRFRDTRCLWTTDDKSTVCTHSLVKVPTLRTRGVKLKGSSWGVGKKDSGQRKSPMFPRERTGTDPSREEKVGTGEEGV